LKVHLANCYGEDKVAMRDRLRWVDQNYTKIVACAEDPIANRWWMDADKPFQFLAACFEFAGYDAEGNNYVCSLPIQVDGSCNGLQHYAAMLRDPVSGAHVNLVPAPKPADIYAEVATHVEGVLRTYTSRTASNADEQAQIDIAKTWLKYGISRAMTKRPVMVLPYGGTREAVKVYVEQYVHEQHDAGVKRPFTNRELRRAVIFLSDIIWRVMGAVVVGPRTAMDWLQSASKTLAAELLPINWTTPSGFLVMQRYPNIEARRVKTKIGDVCVKLTLNGDKPTLDKRKQAQAIAPNFVHSLDASALMLTIQLCHARGITAFSAIHDSYGTLAADMDTLAQALREVFVEMYAARDVLVDFAKEVSGVLPEGKTLPDLPEKGSLDLAGVLSSEFFFA
jgi:DNA-directed RNA polymerase